MSLIILFHFLCAYVNVAAIIPHSVTKELQNFLHIKLT